jgi:hypothetical protein
VSRAAPLGSRAQRLKLAQDQHVVVTVRYLRHVISIGLMRAEGNDIDV